MEIGLGRISKRREWYFGGTVGFRMPFCPMRGICIWKDNGVVLSAGYRESGFCLLSAWDRGQFPEYGIAA